MSFNVDYTTLDRKNILSPFCLNIERIVIEIKPPKYDNEE